MGQSVEQRRRHLRIAENTRPFAKREIGGDDDRGPLVEAADQVEQQLAAGLRERQIAKFIEDGEIEPRQVIGKPTLASRSRLRLEPVDQIDGIEKAPTRPGADATARDRQRQVGFARAGRAREILPRNSSSTF
jgi:hypothetical protein